MAGATYVLDKTYKVITAGGVGQYRAVSPGTNDGECRLPGLANLVCWGITQEAQPNQNQNVTVRKYGISRAYASGIISKGEYVEVAGPSGSLRAADLNTVPGSATVHNIVGIAESSANDGEVFFVFLSPGPVIMPVS